MAIEIEWLAVAWAMEKFYHFLFASHFILEMDPKPLEAILSKSLNEATSRTQQILIRIFAYHFTVRYIPGITNQLADCFLQLGGIKDSIKLTHHYDWMAKYHQKVPSKMHPYQTFREELTVEDGIT